MSSETKDVGLSERARAGDLVHDLGAEPDTGWFIVGEGGYWDVDNACWRVAQADDAPWTSDHFRIVGQVPVVAARVAAERERANTAALLAAADEMEAVISDGDVAEVAAPVPGEVGRASAVAKRDALYEEPHTWLREYAAALDTPREDQP